MTFHPPTRFLQLALVALTCAATSCKKEQPVDNSTSGLQSGQGVFIANEGLYGGGNASVMFYRYNDNTATADLFNAANSRPVGDVLQSMTHVGNELHLMVNNSNRVESVSLPSFVSTGTINGLVNPRNMAVVGNDAFITSYGSTAVTRVSLSTKTVTGEIELPYWSDAIVYHNGELFVTTPSGNRIYICDPTSLAVVDSVSVGVGANGLAVDEDSMLWVFAAGESWNAIGGALVKVDPTTRQAVANFDLGMTIGSAGRLCMNGALDSLYYLNGDVFRMSIHDAALPPAFISAGARYLYSLYRHPTKPLVFVGDAVDFLQNGTMYVYDANGMLQKQFAVGVGPTQIMAY